MVLEWGIKAIYIAFSLSGKSSLKGFFPLNKIWEKDCSMLFSFEQIFLLYWLNCCFSSQWDLKFMCTVTMCYKCQRLSCEDVSNKVSTYTCGAKSIFICRGNDSVLYIIHTLNIFMCLQKNNKCNFIIYFFNTKKF